MEHLKSKFLFVLYMFSISRCFHAMIVPVFLILVLASTIKAQERYTVLWDKVANETVEHLQALVRIDTTNPPGNETQAAEYLKGALEREGISVKLLALDPKRANLVARIRGNGSKKPILVMGHSDVVGVQIRCCAEGQLHLGTGNS